MDVMGRPGWAGKWINKVDRPAALLCAVAVFLGAVSDGNHADVDLT
jgi:hypothetical protein